MRASPLGALASFNASEPAETRSSGRVVVVVQVAADQGAILSIRHRFLFFAWKAGPLARGARRPPRLLLRMPFGARTTWPLHGLIWPKAGFASIA